MGYKPTESDLNSVYEQGFKDAQNGECHPPKGRKVLDVVFAPIDKLTYPPVSTEYAKAISGACRDGHKAGSI